MAWTSLGLPPEGQGTGVGVERGAPEPSEEQTEALPGVRLSSDLGVMAVPLPAACSRGRALPTAGPVATSLTGVGG